MNSSQVFTLEDAEGAHPDKLFRHRVRISRSVLIREEQVATLEIITTAANDLEITPDMWEEVWEFAEGNLLDSGYDEAEDEEERVLSTAPAGRCPHTPDMFTAPKSPDSQPPRMR